MKTPERSFGLSVGAVCGLLAGLWWWRGHLTAATVVGVIASLLLGPALVRPALLRGPSVLWWRFAHALGWINSRLLLSLVFFGVLAPVGLLMRLSGWDPLHRRRGGRASAWVPAPERQRDPKHYERMY